MCGKVLLINPHDKREKAINNDGDEEDDDSRLRNYYDFIKYHYNILSENITIKHSMYWKFSSIITEISKCRQKNEIFQEN